jgi:hypothetical protein
VSRISCRIAVAHRLSEDTFRPTGPVCAGKTPTSTRLLEIEDVRGGTHRV